MGAGKGKDGGAVDVGMSVGASRVGVSGTTRVLVGGIGVGVQVDGSTKTDVGVLMAGDIAGVGVKEGSKRLAV